MFEVLVTYRPDFTEKVVDRYPTREEADAAAQRLASQPGDRVIRVWVRQVCRTPSKS